jgi:type I restriction enzyme S subunit
MEFREGRVNSESNSGYKIINNNDLVLSPQNLWLGNINFNNLGTGIVSPSYKTFKCKNVDIDFIRPQLRNNQMMYQYKNASTQGASVVRRNLDLDLFNQIIISIPNSEEQKMIGRLFSKIDNSIAIHQRKPLADLFNNFS